MLRGYVAIAIAGLLLQACALAAEPREPGALSGANAEGNGVVEVKSLSGTVTDPQGIAVAGATVRLLRRADATGRETKANGDGEFDFGRLDSGEYRLTAEYAGFAPIARTIVVLDSSRTENIQFSDRRTSR